MSEHAWSLENIAAGPGQPMDKAIRGDIVIPERTTFYGSREIGVRAPGGFTVVFAAKA